jgi:hypothetical protein
VIEAYLTAHFRQEAAQAEVARPKMATQSERIGKSATAEANPPPGRALGRPKQ